MPPSYNSGNGKRRGCSAKNIDVDSREASRFATFDFEPLQSVSVPIAIFTCSNPVAVCLVIKEWLLTSIDSRIYGTSDHLRMEEQELEKMQLGVEGKLILLEGAVTLDGGGGVGSSSSSGKCSSYADQTRRKDSGIGVSAEAAKGVNIGIMGLFMPNDRRVRWFYSAVPFKFLLLKLAEQHSLMHLLKVLEPDTLHHKRLYTFLRESFASAIHIPESPDYLNVMSITDYAPPILDHDSSTDPPRDPAIDRILRLESLQHKERLSLENDRYLLCISEPAERELASIVQLHAAEYLKIKRNFFKDFWTAIYRSNVSERECREEGKRVRTDHANQVWLEEAYGWRNVRAKRLVNGWKELGLVDEGRVREWNGEGGSGGSGYEEEGEGEASGNVVNQRGGRKK